MPTESAIVQKFPEAVALIIVTGQYNQPVVLCPGYAVFMSRVWARDPHGGIRRLYRAEASWS